MFFAATSPTLPRFGTRFNRREQIAEAAERVRGVTRTADIPCRVGGDEFSVIMAESGIEQAEQLFLRLPRFCNP